MRVVSGERCSVYSQLHGEYRLAMVVFSFLVIAILLLATLLTTGVEAATTGSIIGTIRDEMGLPMSNVEVTVRGSGFPGYRRDRTPFNGRYHLVLLPPGTYSVEVELSGMKTIVRQNITIDMNETEHLNFVMEKVSDPEIVDLVIITPRIEPISRDGRITIPTEFSQRLPNSSYFRQVISMGGGTVDERAGFFSGSTHIDNLYLVDGLDVTDPVTRMFRVNLNPDSVDQIQVQTGGYTAEYGRATGGVINAITRNGGNTLAGTFRLKYTSDSLTSSSRYAETSPAGSDYFEPMVSIGGPVVRDNLWFFLNYQRYRFDHYVDINNYQGQMLGTDPGTINPSDRTCDLYGGKLTWSVGSWFDLDVFYSKSEAVFENNAGEHFNVEAQNSWDLSESRYGLTMKLIPSASFYLTGTVGSYSTLYFVQPQSESELPAVYDPDRAMWYDNYPFRDRTMRTRATTSLALTQIKDAWRGFQQFTIGVEHQLLEEMRDFSVTTDRYYEIRGYGTDQEEPFRRISFNNPDIETDRAEYWSVYAVESWEMYKNFTLTPSIRWESTQFKNKDDQLVQTFNMMFSPRVSFSWDLLKNGKTKLYGSVGRYYNPYDLTLISMFPGTAQTIEEWLYDPDNPGADAEGYYYNQTLSQTDRNLIDPDIEPESTDEYTAGFDTEIVSFWAAGVRYQYKHTRNIIEDVGFWEDDNGELHLATEVDISDPVAVQNWYDNWDRRYIATNPENAFRDYTAYEIHSTIKSRKLWLEISYTYSQFNGTHLNQGMDGYLKNYRNHFTAYFDTPMLSNNLDGPLSYDMPHNLKVHTVYQLPWRVSIGARFQYRSGLVYNKLGNIGPGPDGVYGTSDDSDNRDPAYGPGWTLPEGRGGYRLPDIFLMDLSLQKDLDFGQWGVLTGIIDVTNLLDNQAVLQRTETEGPSFGSDEEWLSPRMISLQLKYSF